MNATSDRSGGPNMISVIIPTYNGATTLPEQLDALAGQTHQGRWEVIVSDNGSSDGTIDLARRWEAKLPGLRIVRAQGRKGVCHARNKGAETARGDFLVFCEQDDVATPGWLQAMAEAAPSSDLVGGSLEAESLNAPETRAWRAVHERDGLLVLFGFLPFADGCNVGVHASVLQELQGWDEGFLAAGDVELSWRAQLRSYRLRYAPAAVMRYRYRREPGELARQIYTYGYEQVLLYRNYRGKGVARSRLGTATRDWGWIVLHVPYLFASLERRGVWLRRAALRWGRLVGSLRNRVLFL